MRERRLSGQGHSLDKQAHRGWGPGTHTKLGVAVFVYSPRDRRVTGTCCPWPSSGFKEKERV